MLHGKKCFNLDSTPTPLEALVEIELTWSDQERFESMYTPKNLVVLSLSILVLFM